jgi:type III secretory pathway component EscV
MFGKYVLPLLLSGCTFNTSIPVGDSMSQQQKNQQRQEQSQTNSQTASTAADQQSSHASESKQGTNSMPVVIICNQLGSARSNCITPQQPLSTSVKELQK